MTNRVAKYVSARPAGRPDISCPACAFSPPKGLQWMCYPDGCGGTFDTFETRARCPHCQAQFAWTQCPVCGCTSSHQAWYPRQGP
jgi:hypothetical protein